MDLLAILQHAIGRDQYGIQRHNNGVYHRNHYVADEGGDTIVVCRQAVADGLMIEHPSSAITGGAPLFRVTPKGVDYVALNSPSEPKVSRGKQRYLQWLNESDYSGETFGAWMKRKSVERKAARLAMV